ncbi:MAG: hypothetical protein QXF40_01970, partial [Metallosphaera sp.]
MSFTYRPRAVDKIKSQVPKAMQVVGKSGSGKTYAIRLACQELGVECITVDNEDDIPKSTNTVSGKPLIVHLDHPSLWGTVDAKNYVIVEEDKPVWPMYTIWMDVPPLSFFTKYGCNTRNWWRLNVKDDSKDNKDLLAAFNTSNFDGVDNVYIVYDTGIREYYGI